MCACACVCVFALLVWPHLPSSYLQSVSNAFKKKRDGRRCPCVLQTYMLKTAAEMFFILICLTTKITFYTFTIKIFLAAVLMFLSNSDIDCVSTHSSTICAGNILSQSNRILKWKELFQASRVWEQQTEGVGIQYVISQVWVGMNHQGWIIKINTNKNTYLVLQ